GRRGPAGALPPGAVPRRRSADRARALGSLAPAGPAVAGRAARRDRGTPGLRRPRRLPVLRGQAVVQRGGPRRGATGRPPGRAVGRSLSRPPRRRLTRPGRSG